MGDTVGTGRYFEVSATDRTFALLAHTIADAPYLELELDGSLDVARLRAALALVATRHTILTATVDPDSWSASWQPGTTSPQFVELDDLETDGDRTALCRSIRSLDPLDARTGPTCRLVYSEGRRGSRVVLGVSHAVCDARGMVVLLDDVRRAYLRLGHDDRPVVDCDWYPRTPAGLFEMRGVSRVQQLRMARSAWDRWVGVRSSTHTDGGPGPSGPATGEEPASTTDLGPDLSAHVFAAARRLGLSVSHVVLAALARSWFEVIGSDAGRDSISGWSVAVDARRAFGATRGVGNLSGIEPVSLPVAEAETLRATAEAAQRAFRPLRAPGAGMAPELAATFWSSLPGTVVNAGIEATFAGSAGIRLNRVYSHLAGYPESFECWGDVTVRGLHCVAVPPVVAPLVLIVLTTFMGTYELTPIASSEALSAVQADAISASVLRQVEAFADTGAR